MTSSLIVKVKENNLIVVDGWKLEKPKTKEAVRIFSNLKIKPDKSKKSNRLLLLLDKIDSDLKLALRNVGFLNVNLAKDTHVYEIISHQKVIINKQGLNDLTNRLK